MSPLDAADPTRYLREAGAGRKALNLMVGNLHCAGCIARIERTLLAEPGVTGARVNLSTRRLALEWLDGAVDPRRLMAEVIALGYPVAPFDPEAVAGISGRADRELLRALAVSGFAAGNVMLLSVAVWAGAFSDMGVATRDLFHWLSGLIALPAIAYSGRPFFRSAARALAARSLNMDVPISLAVLLAAGMSFFEVLSGGGHVYFDASLTLLFFLLVGRYLDQRARAKARSAAEHLLAMGATAATVINADGSRRSVPSADVMPGMILFIAPGDRIAADGTIRSGTTEIDTSLVSGESLPKSAAVGDPLFAGTLNLSAPIELTVTAAGGDTLLAEIVRLMETAEHGRARYVALADRVARLYAPAVHILAAAAFIGWLTAGGADWQAALLIAVAVLIITCPCALGLAIPAVQVVASGLLLRRGILLKSADGLERLAQTDTIVFDKTGTLTLGRLELIDGVSASPEARAQALALARQSRHPLARALTRALSASTTAAIVDDIKEVPGFGLEGVIAGGKVRLGNRAWCALDPANPKYDGDSDRMDGPELWLSGTDSVPQHFVFSDSIRPDAATTIATLKALGYRIELLSGDREPVVASVAQTMGIDLWRAGMQPADKVARLSELAHGGHKVAMVGDGLNDAPALAVGFVSLSPASAADVSQTAADVIFQGDSLAPVAAAFTLARSANQVIRQNLALAFLYNLVAVPLAIAGVVTPLIAAIAMSASSLAVTINALSLRLRA